MSRGSLFIRDRALNGVRWLIALELISDRTNVSQKSLKDPRIFKEIRISSELEDVWGGGWGQLLQLQSDFFVAEMRNFGGRSRYL